MLIYSQLVQPSQIWLEILYSEQFVDDSLKGVDLSSFLECFELTYCSRVVPEKLSRSLNAPKWGTSNFWPKKTFGKGFLKLVTEDGHALTNPMDSLQAAGVQDGQDRTAVVQQIKVASTDSAFAVWCCGGNGVVATVLEFKSSLGTCSKFIPQVGHWLHS